jgi:methionine-rich copper-binding protein CopC
VSEHIRLGAGARGADRALGGGAVGALRRAAVLLLLTGLALLTGGAPAWAHSKLLGSDPAQGTSLDTPPATVSLTFNEPVQLGFNTITVVGPDGAEYRTGEITAVDTTITVPVLPLGPAGTYELGYRVVSADGHPVSGVVPFTLTKPGPGSSQAKPAGPVPTIEAAPGGTPTGQADSAPVWPWIVGAVVLVGGGVALALRLGRS